MERYRWHALIDICSAASARTSHADPSWLFAVVALSSVAFGAVTALAMRLQSKGGK